MHDSADFTLRITVMAPERAVDDYAPTRPFERPPGLPGVKQGLPGVTGRPASRPQAPQQPPRPMPQRLRSVPPPTVQAQSPQPDPRNVMAPSIPSPTAESALVRVHARSATPRPSPLSDDEEKRVQRRIRANQKIAWARDMLRKFNFEAP